MSATTDAIQAAVDKQAGTFTIKDLLNELGWENTPSAKSKLHEALSRMCRWKEVAKVGFIVDGPVKWRTWIRTE